MCLESNPHLLQHHKAAAEAGRLAGLQTAPAFQTPRLILISSTFLSFSVLVPVTSPTSLKSFRQLGDSCTGKLATIPDCPCCPLLRIRWLLYAVTPPQYPTLRYLHGPSNTLWCAMISFSTSHLFLRRCKVQLQH